MLEAPIVVNFLREWAKKIMLKHITHLSQMRCHLHLRSVVSEICLKALRGTDMNTQWKYG